MRGASKINVVCCSGALALVSIVAACGGENEKPPAPLSYHFDRKPIARLGPQQAIIDAILQWQIAIMENDKAEADYDDSVTQLAIARNDLKQTQIAIDTAITQKNASEKIGDKNAVNQATIQLHNAEELKGAAEARVKFLDHFRKYQLKYWLYTQENQYWREAQLEQVRARLAQQNNIHPQKLDFAWFPNQVDERGKRTQHAKERVAHDKELAASAHASWRKLQDQADKDNGKPTSSWDPMAPQTAPPLPTGQVEIKTMSNAQQPPNGEQPPPPPPPQAQ